MITQELLEYIKQQLLQKVPPELIINDLLAQGWEQNDIKKAFKKIAHQNKFKIDSIPDSVNKPDPGLAKKNQQANLGFILASLGMISWMIPALGFLLTIVALIISINALHSEKRTKAYLGIVLSTIALLLTATNIVVGAYLGVTGQQYLLNMIHERRKQNLENEYFLDLDSKVNKQNLVSDEEDEKITLTNLAVQELKKSISLPQKLDEFTQLIDISAESGAVRYHYLLSNIDRSSISSNLLKVGLVAEACQDYQTKQLLNQNIRMEHSYSFEASPEAFFITITKKDCL
jgi:hypothetical protein